MNIIGGGYSFIQQVFLEYPSARFFETQRIKIPCYDTTWNVCFVPFISIIF